MKPRTLISNLNNIFQVQHALLLMPAGFYPLFWLHHISSCVLSLHYFHVSTQSVVETRIRYWSAVFWRWDILLPCTVNLANQCGFWSAKCWNWSENGHWPAVIFRTDTQVLWIGIYNEFIPKTWKYIYDTPEASIFILLSGCLFRWWNISWLELRSITQTDDGSEKEV